MGPLYWENFFALFMRLLRMLNIVLTIISVSTTHTILYCAATATVLYSVLYSTVLYCTVLTGRILQIQQMYRDYWYSYRTSGIYFSTVLQSSSTHSVLQYIIGGLLNQAGPHHTLLITVYSTTVLYRLVQQYSTVKCSTAQHSTVQYSTVQ